MAHTVKSAEIAKRLMPITANLASWKGFDAANPKGKEYKQEDLEKLGLRVTHTVVIPFFHRDDFADAKALASGYDRVLGEWENVRKLVKQHTTPPAKDGAKTGPAVIVIGKDGKEYELASPDLLMPENRKDVNGATVPYRLADLVFDELVSGFSIGIQGTNGQIMREEAKKALGVPKAKDGASRGSKADASV